MPCVKCDGETPNGWRFCKPCMEKDMAEKKLEEMQMISNKKNNYIDSLTELEKINNFFPSDIEDMQMYSDNNNHSYNNRYELKNELKELGYKVNKLESLIKDTFDDIYVLISKDNDEMIHLHGIFSNMENAMNSYNKIEDESNKYSSIVNLQQLILYKTQLDKLDTKFDTSLFDDCDMEILKMNNYTKSQTKSV